MPLAVVFVGALLGVAVAGFPNREKDTPLAVRTTTPSAEVTTTVLATTTTTTAPPPPTRAPNELKVATVNASGVSGAAARLAARLKEQGYDVGTPISRRAQATSSLVYRPGLDAEARALATIVGLDPSKIEAAESPPGEADLAVIIGEDSAPPG